MSTIEIPAGIGAVAAEVAATQITRGDPDAKLANALTTLAQQAKADVEALEAAPGGGDTSSAIICELRVASWTEDTEAEVDSINRDTASQAGVSIIEPRVFEVSFDAGWPSDIVVRINGKDRLGATIAEDITPPASDAGGVVKGTKVFCEHTTTTIANASEGAHDASIRFRSVIPVPSVPVTAFLHLWHAFTKVSVATHDLTNGWVATTTAIAAADAVHVLYTHTPEIT